MTSFDFESFRLDAVTAAVTPEAPPTAAAPELNPLWEKLEIPDFLKRNPDNSFAHPELSGVASASGQKSAMGSAVEGLVDELPSSLNPIEAPAPELSAEDLRKLHNAQKKKASLEKMKVKQAHAAAMSDGKVWRNGRWRDPDSLTKSEYERILRELDNPSARRLFVHTYSEKVTR